MDQRAIEYCSVIPTKESLTEFGSIDRQEGIHPSFFYPRPIEEKQRGRFVLSSRRRQERFNGH
jgi:hypothetical protein